MSGLVCGVHLFGRGEYLELLIEVCDKSAVEWLCVLTCDLASSIEDLAQLCWASGETLFVLVLSRSRVPEDTCSAAVEAVHAAEGSLPLAETFTQLAMQVHMCTADSRGDEESLRQGSLSPRLTATWR